MTPKSDKPRPGSKPTQSRIGRLTGVRIAGVGGYVPEKLVLNEDLAEMGFDAEWIVQRTGIHERRHTAPGVGTNQLALEAAKRCIESAGVSPEEIDLVIVATVTPGHLLPSTASFLQEQLGLVAGTFDINSACAGFGYAMITGSQFVATGSSKCALVVGADCSSRFSPPEDRNFPLFGDGAGAVILKPGTEEQGLLGFAFGTDGSGREYLYRPMGGSEMPFTPEGIAEGLHYLKMEGRAVFKWAVRTLETSVRQVIERAEVPLEDVNWCAFHQANMRIIDSAISSLGIGSERVVCNLAKYGNTTAASIPLILDELNRAGKIKEGDLILMSGFGAGLTWATMLMRW